MFIGYKKGGPATGEFTAFEYGARVAFSAEASTSSTRILSKGDFVLPKRPAVPSFQLEETSEDVTFSMAGSLCRVQGDRIFCYFPISRRCIILRKERQDRPEKLIARRGGEPAGVCTGFEMYEEI